MAKMSEKSINALKKAINNKSGAKKVYSAPISTTRNENKKGIVQAFVDTSRKLGGDIRYL